MSELQKREIDLPTIDERLFYRYRDGMAIGRLAFVSGEKLPIRSHSDEYGFSHRHDKYGNCFDNNTGDRRFSRDLIEVTDVQP